MDAARRRVLPLLGRQDFAHQPVDALELENVLLSKKRPPFYIRDRCLGTQDRKEVDCLLGENGHDPLALSVMSAGVAVFHQALLFLLRCHNV